jgi:hypothetical protein
MNTDMNTDGDVILGVDLSGGGAEPKAAAPSTIEAASAAARSEEDDVRVCYHESSHAVIGRLVTGQAIGGVTCDPRADFAGLCWGPKYRSKLADTDAAPSYCAQIGAMMPGPGESRTHVADVFLHVHNHVTDLVAGSEGERLFVSGEPWFAASDEREALAYASLITSSPVSAAAFVNACRAEARALLTTSAHIVHSLAAGLRIARTLNGEQVDQEISDAVAAKALSDARQRRDDWKRVEASAALFRVPSTRRAKIAEAVDIVRQIGCIRPAVRAVGLRQADEKAIARICDQRGIRRLRSPALPQWETHEPHPAYVPRGR